MGNTVTFGTDAERRQQAQRSASRRSTNRTSVGSRSGTPSPHHCSLRASSRGRAETLSRRSSTNFSPEGPPKPLTSVLSDKTKEVKCGAGAAEQRGRSSRLSVTDIRSLARRTNFPQQNSTNIIAANALDGAASNDMSFSVPEIDSRSSSTSTMECFFAMAETYSFRSESSEETPDCAAEGHVDAKYHDDDVDRVTPALEFSLTKAPPGTETAPKSVPAAWEMGFGIISGAHRVPPVPSPTVHQKQRVFADEEKTAPALPSPATKTTSGPTTAILSEAVAGLSGSEQTQRPTSAVPKVAKSAYETKPTSALKRLSSAMQERPITPVPAAKAAILPPQPTRILTAEHTTPTVLQQRRVSCQPRLRAAPITERVKGKVVTPHPVKRNPAASYSAGTSPQQLFKKASPPLRPAEAALRTSGHMELFELYDLNFLDSAEPLSVSRAAQTPKTSPATHTGPATPTGIMSLSSPIGSLMRTLPTTTDDSPKGEGRMDVNFSKLTRPVPLLLSPAKQTGTSPPSATAAAARGVAKGGAGGSSSGAAPSACKPFPKDPDSPAPGCSRSSCQITRDGLRRRQATDASPTNCSSSPTIPAAASSSVVNTTTGTPTKGHVRPATLDLGMSVSAAAAAAAPACAPGRGEQQEDEGRINAEGPGSLVMRKQRKASHHHRRRTHRHRSGKKKLKRHNNLYNGGDDEENGGLYTSGKDSASTTDDGSGLDELEESEPNLRLSQKVDSILLRSGSFKSREGGSVGPQDLTPATGSVSFLLCEKEAELANASSQFMSKAVPLRRKEQLRKMNEDFGMGVLSDIEEDAEEVASAGLAAPS